MNSINNLIWLMHLRLHFLQFQIALMRSQNAKDFACIAAIEASCAQQDTLISMLQYHQARLTQGQIYTP